MRALLLALILVSGAVGRQCQTWQDGKATCLTAKLQRPRFFSFFFSLFLVVVSVAWSIVTDSLDSLERGGSLALDDGPGGNLERIGSATRSIIECAEAMLPEAVSATIQTEERDDRECSALFLDTTVSHNVTLATDACCNSTLRSMECCRERPYSYSVRNIVVNPIVAASENSIGLKCSQSGLARYLLSQFERFYSRSINGLCETQAQSKGQTVNDGLSVARLCYERVYRPDQSCLENNHCLSGFCLDERCVPNPEKAASQLLQCLVDNLATDIRPLLKIQLGLTVSSLDADLEAAFRLAVTRQVCEDLLDPLDPFVDSRYTPNAVGTDSREQCEDGAPLFKCEDGGPTTGCSQRSVCSFRDFRVIVNSSSCLGLCSNPGVSDQECELVEGCSVRTDSPAANCVARGMCSDAEYIFGAGTCVEDFLVSGSASEACPPHYIRSPLGCISFAYISSREECYKGRWVIPARNAAASCLASQRCSANSISIDSDNDAPEWKSTWSWTSGRWERGSLNKVLEKRPAKVLRSRRWLSRINWPKLSALLTDVFTQRQALELGSLIRCQVVPALTILKYALCDCSTLSDRPEQKCWDNTLPLILGVRSIAKGTSGRARTSVGFINWFVSSCVDDVIPCQLTFGVLLRPGPSLDRSRANGLSEPIYDASQLTIIGAALSDLSYVGLGDNLRGLVEICIKPELDLQDNCTACAPAFASAPTSLSRLTFLANVPITIREGHYCGSVDASGYYVASRVVLSAVAASLLKSISSFSLLLLIILII